MSFGKKIKELRIKKGLTQIELSKLLSLKNRSYLTDVESDRFIPQSDRLEKFALALDVPKAELEVMALEAKLERIGLTDPTVTLMMKEIPKMTVEEKQSIVKAYGTVIEARERKQNK